MKKLQLKAWYDELNDRLKSDLKGKFEKEFNLGEQGFYSLFRAKTIALERAIFLADFFSKHLAPCHVKDLYRNPLEVMEEHKEAKKKWESSEDESNVIFKKNESVVKHKLAIH